MLAEKAVLGTMLKENYLITESGLDMSYFQEPAHKNIFQAMKNLMRDGKTVDYITLITLSNADDLGGANYISDIKNYANVEKFDDYVSVLSGTWREKEKKNILEIAKQEDWDIAKITTELASLTDNRVSDHKNIRDSLTRVFEDPFIPREDVTGALSGIDQLDKMTNGFHDGEFTVIAARPSMGKTDIMLKIAKHTGWAGYIPALFSLEMPEERLVERMIASTGGFNRSRMRNTYKYLTSAQKDAWTKVIGAVSNTNINTFDDPGQTIPEMKMKVRKLMSEYPDSKPIILIDYLTLIKSPVDHKGNKHAEVSEITKDLKNMAREFNCPVIVLAQLNRAVEQRQDKRPMMSDIRESGSAEEDADTIMFLYRDSYYTKDESDNTMEIILAKNRNGPVGTAFNYYNKNTGEVTNFK